MLNNNNNKIKAVFKCTIVKDTSKNRHYHEQANPLLMHFISIERQGYRQMSRQTKRKKKLINQTKKGNKREGEGKHQHKVAMKLTHPDYDRELTIFLFNYVLRTLYEHYFALCQSV